MASNDYHFITHWRVESTVEEVYEILDNTVDLARWWFSVYLNVQVLEPGDQRGLGKVVSLHTRGWLPYTLRGQFRVIESRYPHGFTLEGRLRRTRHLDIPTRRSMREYHLRLENPS